jgi:hypothetical protein
VKGKLVKLLSGAGNAEMAFVGTLVEVQQDDPELYKPVGQTLYIHCLSLSYKNGTAQLY